MEAMRTHTCGALEKSKVGEQVRLCGWADTVRDHGGVIFIDLRDRNGVTQVIFDPDDSRESWETAQAVRHEYVIQAVGTVEARPDDMVNTRIGTGSIEVRCTGIQILNKSETIPFPLDEDKASKVSEELRLSYRYLDLRRQSLQNNLRGRHKLSHAIRQYLDGQEFLEVETPILSKSTPEGARDYLVPSRVMPGHFFALPQAPQQYKQLLMVAGVDRYFQMARCFRDEDLRADRQPEFTQVDMEMSFVTQEDIFSLIDGMMVTVMEAAGHGTVELPIPRLSWHEAMSRFGSDKPDIRFGLEIQDITPVFSETGFKVFKNVISGGGVVKAINAKGLGDVPIRVVDGWTDVAKQAGLGGLAYIRVKEDGSWKSPIIKFFSEEEQENLGKTLGMEPGDLVLFAADKELTVHEALGRIRLLVGEEAGVIPHEKFAFTWVTNFPLFERNEEGRLVSKHHPFTAPLAEDMHLLDSNPEAVRAQAYDIVLNGCELGGGSIRIHDAVTQKTMFDALGIEEKEIKELFGHLLKALSFGAPPHGGIALGLDRLMMLMVGAHSLRDVIAFPKTQKAVDLMMHAPDVVDKRQLRDVHIELDLPEAD